VPRAGLNRGAVVGAAAVLADEVGWEQLTLAGLAARLGVRLPSLYKHIDSLDGLRRDVAVLALGELGAALGAAAVGRSGGDALRALAGAYRDYARQHPGRYAATVRAPAPGDVDHDAAAEGVLRVVFAVLAGYRLTGEDAVDATRALRATLHGFVVLEAGGGFGMPVSVDRSYDRLVDGLEATLSRWATPAG
jgi:AcrR family transcriptional regulator